MAYAVAVVGERLWAFFWSGQGHLGLFLLLVCAAR